jgi:AcrR family transcriptional regulator
MREKGQSRNGSSREESTPAVPKAFVPSAPTRRRLPPAARRGQIIEAAAAFFAEVGLEGRTRDLSKRLGITQSLLYKYFDSKEALLEAVFEHVYIGRLSPEWPKLLRNRRLSLRDRLVQFYCEYTDAIFTYEWMRIFMFSGLAGERLNQRYLAHLKETLLEPLLLELQAGSTEPIRPHIEDIWNLHGGIVYLEFANISTRCRPHQMYAQRSSAQSIGSSCTLVLVTAGNGALLLRSSAPTRQLISDKVQTTLREWNGSSGNP